MRKLYEEASGELASMSSEGEGNEVVFLSPNESPSKDSGPSTQEKDQGGVSPALRRSTRKRKSVTTVMTKGSGSKKKRLVHLI